MAHKKAGGSTSLGRDSRSKRLGVKLFAGQEAKAGAIVIRQRGNKYRPGKNVKQGSDDTLFATASGTVSFRKLKRKKFDGSLRQMTYVDVTQKNS